MTTEPVAAAQLLYLAREKLSGAGIANAGANAEMLLSDMLAITIPELRARPDRTIENAVIEQMNEAVERRKRHEPIQYILGSAWFRELRLDVGKGVLIPRPETELMAEYVLRHAVINAKVCELGTGSGAVAISLAMERPDLTVTGIELSNEAIRYAGRNAERYRLPNLKIISGNLFEPVSDEKFDFIAANLPYVTKAEFAALDREVGEYEPATALLGGGDDGLDIIRRLISLLPRHLAGGGGVILELGINQSEEVSRLLKATGMFRNVQTIHDYSDRPRFVAAG